VAAILPAEAAVPADAVAVEAVVAEEEAVPAADAEPSLADASFGGTSEKINSTLIMEFTGL
jgi:hypothetical protein